MKTKPDVLLTLWREKYSYAIPTIITAVYVNFYFIGGISFLNGVNIPDALTAIITAISILTGFIAALIGLVIQIRDSSETIKYFFEVADGEHFVKQIKKSILSGFLGIFISCLLYFEDSLGEIAFYISAIWMWVLFYYLSSTYRFISIFIGLLLKEKKKAGKEEDGHMSNEQSQDLQARLRRKNQRIP